MPDRNISGSGLDIISESALLRICFGEINSKISFEIIYRLTIPTVRSCCIREPTLIPTFEPIAVKVSFLGSCGENGVLCGKLTF